MRHAKIMDTFPKALSTFPCCSVQRKRQRDSSRTQVNEPDGTMLRATVWKMSTTGL